MLFTFSHIGFLKHRLIHKDFPNSFDWGELICQYFDDLYLDHDYQDSILDGTISNEEFEIIRPFHYALKNYVALPHTQTPKWIDSTLMNDREWLEVISIGKIAWGKLKAILTDPNELDFALKLESNDLSG